MKTLCGGMLLTLLTACGEGTGVMKSYNEGINIIPMPQVLEQTQGRFTLKDGQVFGVATPESETVAQYFIQKMKRATGYEFKVAQQGDINLILREETSLGQEGYQLKVTPKKVEIIAQTPQGLFYGLQSFMQLLPAEIESPAPIKGIAWTAQAVNITDHPRFSYRGVHVDPSRHFQTVDELKKEIDVLALFKINQLHWHLTDDQGWRIEIKKYPKLTEVGATRIDGERTEYKGFYTQEEVKDIVKYAADRFITVIPELEIPGHEMAAIAAYPELSCKGEPGTPRIIWGVEDIVMCPGKELMFDFLEDVIDEMVPLFPATYFHIGGDECPKASWKACPLCQQRIRQEKLKDGKHAPEELLQTYVVERIEKYLNKYGKKIIGWDEILEGNPAPSATIMSWRGEEGGLAAAMAGHDAIMTPGPRGMYLDHYQGDPKIEPVTIGGYALLEKSYDYDPVPDTLKTLGKDKHIVGVQGNTWSEYMYTNDIREYQTFPRIIAIAEIGWTETARKDFADFKRRINNAYVRMDGHGINYHIPLPEQPNGSCNRVAFLDQATLEFTNTRQYPMVYTTDGSDPTATSARYEAPLALQENTVVKIATLLPSDKLSQVRTIQVEKETLAPAKEVADKKPGLNMEVTYGYYLNVDELAQSKKKASQKNIKELRELTTVEKSSESMRNVKQYAAVATGFIDIPEDGVYFLSSDLEEVWIDGKLLINNRGEVKRFSRHDNSIALAKGLHEVKAVFLGHIIGGWPSNWNDGSISLRRSDEAKFQKIEGNQLWH